MPERPRPRARWTALRERAAAAPRRTLAAALVGVAAIALLAGVVSGAGRDEPGAQPPLLDGRSPRQPDGERVRVLVTLPRPALGARPGAQLPPALQRAYVRSLAREGRALQSALEATGVAIERPVSFGRVFSGFAATVAADDLPQIQTLGAGAQPVRRFFPATGRSRPLAQVAAPAPAAPRGAPRIALLDSGVDTQHPALAGRVVAGHDAVTGAGPRRGGDEHGTELAGVLADATDRSERLLAIRVAGARGEGGGLRTQEYGTSDELIGGLERAVDPDGDGDTEDAVAVALVGVSSPYAGFSRSPEARAVQSAGRLGSLVVAPAGNDGPRAGRFGTVGSPAAAPAALAVAALSDDERPAPQRVRVGIAGSGGRALLDGRLLGGDGRALSGRASALVGPSQADPRARGLAGGADPLEYFGVDARPRARAAVVFVPAGARSAAAPAVAAAQAGAAALVICSTEGASASALPRGLSGRMPVVELAGGDARRALELTRSGGGIALLDRPRGGGEAGDPTPGSSEGPTYSDGHKPDLAMPDAAVAPRPGGRTAAVAGSSVAAARAAATALELHRLRPAARPAQLAAALVGTARPAGPTLAAGAGRPDAARAARAPVLAQPHALTLRATGSGGSARVALSNPGTRPVTVSVAGGLARGRGALAVSPARVTIPPGRRTTVTVDAAPPRGGARTPLTGRLRARAPSGAEISVVLLVAAAPPPPRLGALALVERSGQVQGVRFAVGAVHRSGAGVAVEPVGRLDLELIGADGQVARELTPATGATDLLPGEYAYTLTRAIRSGLAAGRYRFRARAVGTAGGRSVVDRSPAFSIR